MLKKSVSSARAGRVAPAAHRVWRAQSQIFPEQAARVLANPETPADDQQAERHWRFHTMHPREPEVRDDLPPRLVAAVNNLRALGSATEIINFWNTRRSHWEKRKQKLRKEQKAWRAAMAPTVEKVAGHLALPLLQEMLREIVYEDMIVVRDLRRGFRVMGRIPAAGVFGGSPPR